MSKYLDKFLTTIPAIQGKQVFKLLTVLKDSGAIRTINEYNQRLQKLSQHLQSTSPKPFLKLFEADVGNEISSDQFNAMVEAAQMDMETVFSEADKIAEVLELHKTLYKLTVLTALTKSVEDLARTIDLYEFLSGQVENWNNVQYNTFNTTESNMNIRSEEKPPALFRDYRRADILSSSEDCKVDLYAKSLTLPSTECDEVKVVNIALIDNANTNVSLRNVQHSTSSLQNIRDGKPFTYWLYPILTASPIINGARIKMELQLGGLTEFNSIEIEPACHLPMLLEEISYIAENAEIVTIDMEDMIIDKDIGINLGSIVTQSVTLTFRQENLESTAYNINLGTNMWERVWKDEEDAEIPDSQKIECISDELFAVVPDANMRELFDISTLRNQERINAYQYTFGFDNIRLYKTNYKSRGIFVGDKLHVTKPGLIGLRTTEINPELTIGPSQYQQFSFEYNVIKVNYDTSGVFISTEVIPILPIGYNGINTGERIFLASRVDSAVYNVGSLRFVPDFTSGDPVIKENLSTTLTVGTDYLVRASGMELESGYSATSGFVDSWTTIRTWVNATSDLTVPMVIEIQFLSPNMRSVYTADYIISTRNNENSDAKQRKLLSYITLQDNYTVRCDQQSVDHADLYLHVIMRNNYWDTKHTCSLLDYRLVVSSYDNTKFLEG